MGSNPTASARTLFLVTQASQESRCSRRGSGFFFGFDFDDLAQTAEHGGAWGGSGSLRPRPKVLQAPAWPPALPSMQRIAIVPNWDYHISMRVKADFGTASILKEGRVVFNIAGNKYRLVTSTS